MEDELGVEEDGGRKIIVLIHMRNDSHLTKIVAMEMEQS